MSQPDLLTKLRESRPIAPSELRERVRRIAAQAAPETPAARHRISWRRALVVAVPVAAAAIAAAAFLPSSGGRRADTHRAELSPIASGAASTSGAGSTSDTAAPTFQKTASPSASRAAVPAPSGKRLQNYSASLELRVANATAVSGATNKAIQIASALHGYSTTVNVSSSRGEGYASLVLRIPVDRVREAVRRLSVLGTIVGENVSIKDVQAKVDSTDRLISRLQNRLTTLRALPQTDTTLKQIAAITTQIRHLRIGKASTVRTAQLATIRLQLTSEKAATPVVHRSHGPLHKLGVIFRDAGIGAVYALALGAPLAILFALGWWLIRSARRRREEKLLSEI